MTHEESRELQVLSAAEGHPLALPHYSFTKDPELAATARRLGREPTPHLIEVVERPIMEGPAIYPVRIRESGKARLTKLRAKLVAEQRCG